MGSRLFRLICLDAFPEYGLHIPHGLLNKGGVVQLFRVHHMAVHNAALGQGLPDGDGVYIVQIVLFDLGVEAVLLDELGQGSTVPLGLSGRIANGVLPSPPSNSWASHAAVSFFRAWSFM